jgi:isopropylmalate/homocitrate/citramalate synthase
MASLYLLDTTNRDGVQTARIILSKLQKTMVNIYLGQMGVHQSEMGFPYTGHERNYIKANLELAEMGVMNGLILSGWLRAQKSDVVESLKTGLRDFDLSMSTSPQMIQNKFKGKLTPEQVIQTAAEAVGTAIQLGARSIIVSAEDSSRSDPGYLVEFGQAVKAAGATRLRYCDTLGYDTPESIAPRVRRLAEDVGLPIEMHCHNDLGLAVANSLSGALAVIEAGQDCWINTTVNGMGERAGNADLVSILLAIHYGCSLKERLPLGSPVDMRWAWTISRYVAEALGQKIPINHPGVGDNAFAHESGIHADGALKDRHNYELFDYDALGRPEFELRPTGRIITTGEYGGLAGLKHVYGELGIEFANDDDARTVLELVQLANAHNQAPLTADELRFIARFPRQAALLLTVVPSVAPQTAFEHARPEWNLPWELPSGVKPLTLDAVKTAAGVPARRREGRPILFE